jgi:NitT/TauT family transport system permease protein
MHVSQDSASIYESDAERRAQGKYRRSVIIGQVALIVAVLALWQFGSGRLFDPFFVGNPAGVANVLIKDLFDPHFYADLAVTGLEMAWGYLLGVLLGVGFAVIFARWRLMADIFDPFFSGLNSLPRIALAPLLVIWFGIDMASKAVLAATLVFFLMFFTTLSGIRNVDPALVDLARLVGATKRQIFRFIILPAAAVWVINGLKVSLPYALIGVIVGEFIVSSSGLGYRLNAYSTSYNTNGTFAMLLVMMALMMVLNALVNIVERRLLRWRTDLGPAITY